MGELACLFGQLTPVKYPSLSPVAGSKSSLVVPASAHFGLRATLVDAFVWIIQQLRLSISPVLVFARLIANHYHILIKITQ